MEAKDFLQFALDEKHLFINAKDDYSEAVIGQVVEINDNEAKVLWYSISTDILPKGIKYYEFDKFYSEVTPFLIVDRSRVFTHEAELELQKKLNDWHIVVHKLYNSEQHRVKVADCISIISDSIGVTKNIAISLIKASIARNKFKYERIKVGKFIALSDEVLEVENKKRYLSSISDEIKSKSERIDYVISHGQTVGNYREKLFISVLRKYIPTKFHIATGFIDGSSKQIDVIIYDQHNYLPIFREDDLVVVKKESVIAVIEIKTTLDQNTLKNSLEGITKICNAGITSVPFFKGIFAFSSDLTNSVLIKHIANFYKENPIEAIHEHLDVICVPQHNSLFIDYNNLEDDKQHSCPTLYEVENFKGINVEETIFFQKLFSFLEVEKSAKKINRLYFNELFDTAKIKSNTILTEKDWTPLRTFYSEWETTQNLDLETQIDEAFRINIENVKKRVNAVKKWNDGKVSREDLINNYNDFLE